MTEPLSNDFDWVSARAECSASKVFRQLELQVKTDVEKRNLLRTDNEKSKYFFECASDGFRFSVFLTSHSVETEEIGATFSRTPQGIDVHSLKGELLFSGTVTLSNDRECRVKVGGNEYNCWQFRKLALEDVFFTKVARWRP
jgi:hypothetical protein